MAADQGRKGLAEGRRQAAGFTGAVKGSVPQEASPLARLMATPKENRAAAGRLAVSKVTGNSVPAVPVNRPTPKGNGLQAAGECHLKSCCF